MSYSELSGEDKKQIVKSQIKNVQYNKYNAELNMQQEQALDEPNSLTIFSIQAEFLKYSTKEEFLQNKLDELNIQYPQVEEEI